MPGTSLKTNSPVLAFPPTWVPSPIQWSRDFDAPGNIPSLTYARNIAMICIGTMIDSLFSNTLVAYGFARLEWRGRDALFVVVLATLMLPYQVTTIPSFIFSSDIGWTNWRARPGS